MQSVAVHKGSGAADFHHEHQLFLQLRGDKGKVRLLFPAEPERVSCYFGVVWAFGFVAAVYWRRGCTHRRAHTCSLALSLTLAHAAPAQLPLSGAFVMVRTTELSRCAKNEAGPIGATPICVVSMMAHECEFFLF